MAYYYNDKNSFLNFFSLPNSFLISFYLIAALIAPLSFMKLFANNVEYILSILFIILCAYFAVLFLYSTNAPLDNIFGLPKNVYN